MKQFLIIIIILFLITPCFANEKNISIDDKERISFFINPYGTVYRNLKGGQGAAYELAELINTNPGSASFIIDFWKDRVSKICKKEFKKTIDEVLNNSNINSVDQNTQMLKEFFPKCLHQMYYYHWDEINDMIVNQLEYVKKHQPPGTIINNFKPK